MAQAEFYSDTGTDEVGGRRDPKPLKPREVLAIIQGELERSIGSHSSRIANQQRDALKMYNGDKLGNEIEGRSQVRSRDTLETVEWAMPSFMRIYASGKKIFTFTAINPDDQENADLATVYINHLLLSEIEGHDIIYNWMKDALLQKVGVIKTFYEERKAPKVRSYKGLTEDEVAIIAGDEEVEILSHYARFNKEIGAEVHDITVKEWKVKGRLVVEGVAPEEFKIASRAVRLDDDTPFTAHHKKVSISQLVELGFNYDDVKNIPSDDSLEFQSGRVTRRAEDDSTPFTAGERQDPASREVWVTECHIKIDEDGDGYSELRKILVAGTGSNLRILEDEEEGFNPFSTICPIPTPHKFYGLSLADLVMDIEVLRTTILRQMMDSIFLSNNPRLEVMEGMVEYEDLLTARPGGLVRVRQMGSIAPIEIPRIPQEAFELYNGLEETRANRTGIMAHGNSLDASAINSTATGLAQLMAEKQQKIELIARIFKRGFKDWGKKILRTIIENDTKTHQIQIAGKFMTFDPKTWDFEMAVEVELGFGAGQSIEHLNNLGTVAALQEKIFNSPAGHLVSAENVWEMAKRTSEAAGFYNEDLFFTNPKFTEPPPPPPNPDMEKIKLDAEKSQMDFEIRKQAGELDFLKEQGIQTHRLRDLEQNYELEMARIQSQERIGLGQQGATIEAAEISADARSENGSNDGN